MQLQSDNEEGSKEEGSKCTVRAHTVDHLKLQMMMETMETVEHNLVIEL